jgi:hypothetical protein
VTRKSSTHVQSLVGSNQLSFYLKCLKSLIANSVEKLELLLHSDGSLTDKDKKDIFSYFPDNTVKLVESDNSKQKTLDFLERRPNCQKVRKESIWGIEFFDPLFAIPTDPVSFYIDADILFIRPFQGLFNHSKVEESAIFIRDIQWDAYSLRPWHLCGFRKKPKIVKGITTAMVFWDKRAIDWDYLEWFLGQTHLHAIPEWILPTAQAGLANKCDAKTVCHKQVQNLYPNSRIDDQTFAVHLLGSYRKEWLNKVDKYKRNINLPNEIITTKFDSCIPRSFVGYTLNQAKRWRNTRLNSW